MQERRQIQRLDISLFVKFSTRVGQGIKSEGFTEDVSLGGARLLSLKRPSLNANLDLSIDVPNNPDMTLAEASVRWIGSENKKDDIGREVFPVGVEFTFIDQQDKVYLEEYLALQKKS
ncbi:MAG: PilZ domain-containing protein [Candidatus Omnitrophica bacterium]|nr:PilZ domain-containing protein [Candidatus Omnitrophota bacterium]MCK5493264.1 PilZ domain-containing protein [Candidatus Omnitrophota bacterium]